uniref:Uncharacterized protein n=1 Tax=Branchiostoma floridae TaxID=7739 RepID=C3ZAB2_BRAFL|eukprot:XP_002594494.1 hypothetical protein BRAFLDRAFT_87686 [Branchiostoma floridae]
MSAAMPVAFAPTKTRVRSVHKRAKSARGELFISILEVIFINWLHPRLTSKQENALHQLRENPRGIVKDKVSDLVSKTGKCRGFQLSALKLTDDDDDGHQPETAEVVHSSWFPSYLSVCSIIIGNLFCTHVKVEEETIGTQRNGEQGKNKGK